MHGLFPTSRSFSGELSMFRWVGLWLICGRLNEHCFCVARHAMPSPTSTITLPQFHPSPHLAEALKHLDPSAADLDYDDEKDFNFLNSNKNLLNTTEQTVYVVRAADETHDTIWISIRRTIISTTMCPTLFPGLAMSQWITFQITWINSFPLECSLIDINPPT